MINKEQRIKLRSMAQTLPDLVYIGKEDLTENVIAQIENNLYAHELIKLKVQNTCETELEELSNIICTKCQCEVVSIIGRKIILYKLSDKKNMKHIL